MKVDSNNYITISMADLLGVHSMTDHQAVFDTLWKMAHPAAHQVKHSTIGRYILTVSLCHLCTECIIHVMYYAWLLCTVKQWSGMHAT